MNKRTLMVVVALLCVAAIAQTGLEMPGVVLGVARAVWCLTYVGLVWAFRSLATTVLDHDLDQ